MGGRIRGISLVMCGFAGFWTPPTQPRQGLEESVRVMSVQLTHRGPDDYGQWLDERVGIALGHRRLSVVDLSVEGRQPMHSQGGRYSLAFNGEIYNWRHIRHDLDSGDSPPAWRGHSDTEVMLAAFERWGLEHSLNRFVGMFAFALWVNVAWG